MKLYGLFCPNNHLVYFTNKKFEKGDVLTSKDFFVKKNYIYEKKSCSMWWDKPPYGQPAICPIDGEPLQFKSEYLKEILEEEDL